MDPTETRKFDPQPCAMAVGLSDAQIALCERALHPLPIMKVAHVRAASERMLVTRPRLVLVPSDLSDTDLAKMKERAEDVGAVLVQIDERPTEAELVPRLLAALARTS